MKELFSIAMMLLACVVAAVDAPEAYPVIFADRQHDPMYVANPIPYSIPPGQGVIINFSKHKFKKTSHLPERSPDRLTVLIGRDEHYVLNITNWNDRVTLDATTLKGFRGFAKGRTVVLYIGFELMSLPGSKPIASTIWACRINVEEESANKVQQDTR